jgi:hypothetical protein
MIPFLLFLALMVITAGLAFRVGGVNERIAASTLLAATFLSPVLQSHNFAGPETGLLLIDVVLFSTLLVITLRSTAFWPMWAAGFQLCALAVHLAAAKSPDMLPAAYAETLAIWSVLVVSALAAGILLEARMSRGRS